MTVHEPFKLIREIFSEIDQEWQWTYSVNFPFTFNKKLIIEITITDHPWRKKGREKITKELILKIFASQINGERLNPEPKTNPAWTRDHFVPQQVLFNNKKYKLVFWFKDGTTNHLWVKNCHQQD